MNDQLSIKNLFEKFLRNQCNDDEVKILLHHFKVNDNEELLRGLIVAELNDENELLSDDTENRISLEKVKQNLLAQLKTKEKIHLIKRWFPLAAILLLLIGAGTAYYNYRMSTLNYFIPVKIQTLTTEKGERKTIELADGTKIWLAPGSSLRYPEEFRGNLREVRLAGEAFFEVAKDKTHPFIIHSGLFNTRVVGTSFTIRAYKGLAEASVTVVTGIVQVSAKSTPENGSTVILKPNQKAVFDQKSGTLSEVDDPDASLELKRKDGILTYKGAPVQEVVADFSKYYNVSIVIKNKLMTNRCYGEFDLNRPLKVVMEQLTVAINAKYNVQQGKYVIRGGGKMAVPK